VGFGGQHGYYTDPETGLSLLTHRYYDAGAGRFVTRDPIGYRGGINLYGFAGNNPVNRMDPEGTAPPTKGPFGEPIGPNDLHTHYPDTYHAREHYDYKIRRNPISPNPNEAGLREYRFYPDTNKWEEKQGSRQSASRRRLAAADRIVNAAERANKGGMSKVNKARLYRSLFATWAKKILKYIPETPPQLEIFNFLPAVEPDRLFWMQRHPHADPGDYDKYGKYEGQG